MKIPSVPRIQYHIHYIYIYQDQYFNRTLQLQISNYLKRNLCLCLLIMYLVCKKYASLLHFYEKTIHYLFLNNFREVLLKIVN